MIINNVSKLLFVFIAVTLILPVTDLYGSSEKYDSRYNSIKKIFFNKYSFFRLTASAHKSLCDLEISVIKNKESYSLWLKQCAEPIIGSISFGMGTFFATRNQYTASLPFISFGIYLLASQKKK